MTDQVSAAVAVLRARGVRRGFPAQRVAFAQEVVRRGWTAEAINAAATWLERRARTEDELAARLAGLLRKADGREFQPVPAVQAVANRCVHGVPPSRSCPACAAGVREGVA